jgi:acetylornithine deacetylase
VLARLERLDRELQARPPHPLMGTGSLHASTITGGGELSVYPDACRLQMERRTVAGESGDLAASEVAALLRDLAEEDGDFTARASLVLARPPYEIAGNHPLPGLLQEAAAGHGLPAPRVAMSFWTDAAILGGAGIPAVLFGPGGAGLHSREEYVKVDDVVACRDVLASFARSLA